MSSIECYNTTTEDQTKIHTIIWKLPNFKNILEDKTNRQLRPETSNEPVVAEASDSRFQVKMQFLGRENDLIDIYYLSTTPVFLKLILRCNNLNPTLLNDSDYHAAKANKWQHVCTLYKSKFSSLVTIAVLTLHFEFFVKDIKFDRANSPILQLSNDFENLLNNGIYYDVTMKSTEGVEYKVHKVVLVSRSAVLKAHFEHNTTECVTNVVESPLESEELREVLTFIYSDKAPRVEEIPEKLLAAADYYQLSGLISLCGEVLQKKLTVENAIGTLELAELHSTNALKQATLEFIKDGQAMPAIIKTEGWAKLKSVELIKEIFEYLMTEM